MELNQINEKLKKIKLLAMDVDGTLTDGAMYYSEEGEALKRFSTIDGMGITLLRLNGIKTAIITSEDSEIARKRAKKLNIDYVLTNIKRKDLALDDLTFQLDLTKEEIAYIGDDINDISAISRVGFFACPADAQIIDNIEIDLILTRNGGYGAVRELAELILISQNKSLLLPENWK